MKFVLIFLAGLGLAGCASVQQVSIYDLDPGTKSDGLYYNWQAYEQNFYGGGMFFMTPDGSIFRGGERIGKNQELWTQIADLVDKFSGIEKAALSVPEYPDAILVVHRFNSSNQDVDGRWCMSHWTEHLLQVKIGGKRAFSRAGECSDDSYSDKAGREIRKIFTEYVRNLKIEDLRIY